MPLSASRLGFGVPTGDFAGRVHSVFRHACLIATDSGLVTLLPASAGGMPGAISVDAGSGLDLRDVAVGAAAGARSGVLRIGGAALVIDLRPAVAWRSRLDDIGLDPQRANVKAAWQTAAARLTADGRHRALASLGAARIAALLAATAAADPPAAAQAARDLIGLGAGGTPAGDDFLVGYLAALWPIRAARPVAEAVAAAIRTHAARTNDVSRVYLAAAAAGEASERLADLVRGIADGDPAVSRLAEAAIAVGHSSGADGTFGVLAGVAALGAIPEPAWPASSPAENGRRRVSRRRR